MTIRRHPSQEWTGSLFPVDRSCCKSLSRAIVERAGNESQAMETEFRHVLAAIASYERWAREEFYAVHDHFRLLGEDNFRRYLPVEPLRIRVHPDDSLREIFCRAAAARAAGCRATISSPPSVGPPSRGGQEPASAARLAAPTTAAAAVALLDELTDSWAGAIEFIEEDDQVLAAAIRAGHATRIRYAAPSRVPETIRAAAADSLQYVADTPVSLHGRVELLWYLREQSVSHVYHRYGNLGLRG